MTRVGFVPIQIKPGYRDQFVQAMTGHARGTRENGPGCLRFDIIQDAGDPNRIWLHEVYRDEEAQEAHSNAPHSLHWRTAPSREWRDEPPTAATRSYTIWPDDE